MNAPSWNKVVRRTGLGLLSLATAASALAFTFVLNDKTGLPIKWPAGTIRLKIALNATATGSSGTLIDGSTFDTSAQAAAAAWNAELGAAQFQTELSTGTPTDNNDLNELGFAAQIYGKDFDETTLAVTTGYSVGNERVEADIIFNSKYTWNSYRGNLRTPASYDIRRVAIHEMGHILGLSHPDEKSQVVNAIMNSRISNLDTLATDDTSGAQSLYGPPGAPANDAFASATPITLTTGNNTSLSGYNTNATKEGSEPRHADNSGGRSVWWRWTAPSSGSITLDTKGSYYDTTLGVYTGSALSALATIASDDDVEDGVIQASTVTFSVISGTTYRFAVDGYNSNDGRGADNGGITLNLAFTSNGGTLPVITTQPNSATVTAGNSVSFTITATGTDPLSYQWYLGGVVISGATSATYSIASAAASQAGNYTITVTNAAGSVTSAAATLTVNAAPTPTPAPSSGGGGGGGGAAGLWFVGALAVLSLTRFFARRRA